jgi:outer membrane protein assembly factor BamE (lipoprotein component of BamABCDE complex)
LRPKTQVLLFVLCLVLGCAYSAKGEQSLKKENSIITSAESYQDSLEAFEKIKEGMGQEQVRNLLGAPDRVNRGDSDQSWYDESWTYDFRKLAGYPKGNNLRAVWEGTIMFLNREVVHTRKIGWLE